MVSISPVALWILLVLFPTYISHCLDQNGNSRPRIESLIHMESEMIDLFHYALREEQRLHDGRDVHGFSKLYKFLEDVEPVNEAATNHLTNIADDLLQILILKRRLSRDWAPMLDLIHQSEFVKRVPIMLRKIESMQYVISTECDLRRTIVNDILRVQHYYKAMPTDLQLNPRDGAGLESEDVARLVSAAQDVMDYSTALKWIKFGYASCNGSTEASMKKYFLNLKAGTYIKMNDLKKAEKIYSYLTKLDPSSRSAESNLRFVRNKIAQGGMSSNSAEHGNFSDDYIMQLCRDNVQPNKVGQGILKCYSKVIEDLERPVLIEEIHDRPRIVLLKHFFSDTELQYIQRDAQREMLERLLLDTKYTTGSSRLQKDSQTTYLQKFFSTMVNVTYQGSNVRREDIFTNTKIECEGPGGKSDMYTYQPWHMDTLERTLPIVNFVTFMDHAVSGGGITFPDLHLTIKPERGSVLFWQFKSPHGSVHPRLRRFVDCPIVKGSQWVIRSSIEHRGLIRRIDL